jgi:hypothetical protein
VCVSTIIHSISGGISAARTVEANAAIAVRRANLTMLKRDAVEGGENCGGQEIFSPSFYITFPVVF